MLLGYFLHTSYNNYYNFQSKYKDSVTVFKSQTAPEKEFLESIEDENDICWWKFNVEPIKTVFEVWARTYQYRKNIFETAESLEYIFETLPILKQSFGFELVNTIYLFFMFIY